MLKNLSKAALAVAVTPVTLAADVVMLIPDSENINKPAFSRTGKMFDAAEKALEEAVKPEQS